MTGHKFYTAIREEERKFLEKLGTADIVVGIPCYHNDDTIRHVIEVVSEGLMKYFPDKHSLIYVSDGGSTDDTREEAECTECMTFNVHVAVSIYRGLPGKGSALRAVFEAVKFLGAKGCCVVDADLKSITPEWINNLLSPVVDGRYDYVTPFYYRYKYDGTITNTIAYNLNRSLYGKRIRQPIGGDFGISKRLVDHYLEQDVWESEIAKFGIDIWMTTEAETGPFKICQTKLGVKIHKEKDPATSLGPMFTQVVSTIYTLMHEKEHIWKKITHSEDVPFVGEPISGEPKPFQINLETLKEYFYSGYNNFSPVWRNILNQSSLEAIDNIHRTGIEEGVFPNDEWVKIVYDYSIAYNTTRRQRTALLQTMIPLYHLRVARLVMDLESIEDERQIEVYFDKIAADFESMKPYLVEKWNSRKEEIVNV